VQTGKPPVAPKRTGTRLTPQPVAVAVVTRPGTPTMTERAESLKPSPEDLLEGAMKKRLKIKKPEAPTTTTTTTEASSKKRKFKPVQEQGQETEMAEFESEKKEFKTPRSSAREELADTESEPDDEEESENEPDFEFPKNDNDFYFGKYSRYIAAAEEKQLGYEKTLPKDKPSQKRKWTRFTPEHPLVVKKPGSKLVKTMYMGQDGQIDEGNLPKRSKQDFGKKRMVYRLTAEEPWCSIVKTIFVPLTNTEVNTLMAVGPKVVDDCSKNEDDNNEFVFSCPTVEYIYHDLNLFHRPTVGHLRAFPFCVKRTKKDVVFSGEKYQFRVNLTSSMFDETRRFDLQFLNSIDLGEDVVKHRILAAKALESTDLHFFGGQDLIPTWTFSGSFPVKMPKTTFSSDSQFLESAICCGILHNYNMSAVVDVWIELTGNFNFTNFKEVVKFIDLVNLVLVGSAHKFLQTEKAKFRDFTRNFMFTKRVINQFFVIILMWYLNNSAVGIIKSIWTILLWFFKCNPNGFVQEKKIVKKMGLLYRASFMPDLILASDTNLFDKIEALIDGL
jgi:hypothetical protein